MKPYLLIVALLLSVFIVYQINTKDTAIEEIFERITQDVFNASLAKW